jgi:hypothetical protein
LIGVEALRRGTGVGPGLIGVEALRRGTGVGPGLIGVEALRCGTGVGPGLIGVAMVRGAAKERTATAMAKREYFFMGVSFSGADVRN